MAALVLGTASAVTLAIPAHAASGTLVTVINVHYNSCLSELGANAGPLIGLDIMGQPSCGLVNVDGIEVPPAVPTPQHSETWTIATPTTSGGKIVNCVTSTGTNLNCFELVNYHSNLCLTEDELEAEVEPCAPSNGDDLWTAYGEGLVNYQVIFQLRNIHYGLCLGSGSLGLGGTGMNTCSSNHADDWYLPN